MPKDKMQPHIGQPQEGHDEWDELETLNDWYADIFAQAGTGAGSPENSAFDSYLDGEATETESRQLTREDVLALASGERVAILESHLLELVARVLRVSSSRIEKSQALANLGVDSLEAVELANRLETELMVTIPMVHFLQEDATVVKLADQVLNQLTALPQDSDVLPISRVASEDGEHPLSYGQRALWFLNKLEPGNIAYNVMFAARILSPLDTGALTRAFQQLVDRHPALRTTYREREHEPVQVIHPRMDAHVVLTDVSACSAQEIEKRLTEESHRSFDLEQGPLLRVHLFTRSETEHLLLLVAHHIAFDFWSLDVMVDEWRVLYAAECAGNPVYIPTPELDYTDYAHWQQKMLGSERGEQLLSYWQERLKGVSPVLNLPTDRPRPPVQTYHGATQPFEFSRELTERIKGLAKREGATLFMTLLTAFQTLLHRYSGQEDIVVGSPAANRDQAKLEGIVGYFADPVALRTKVSGEMTFQALLGQVRQNVLGAIAHQEYPFPLLVEKLQVERDPSHSPLFQTMFIIEKPQRLTDLSRFFLGEAGATMQLGDLQLESLALEQRIAQVDLTLMVAEADGKLLGTLQYNTDLFDADTVARMSGHLETLLASIVEAPESKVAELSMLTDAERGQLLREWNDTLTDVPVDRCIHHLFEEQVVRTPDAVAVVFEEQQLTYRELNERANQGAHMLQQKGVGPDVLVGIFTERSLEMMVGLLAILKAGGAYVPLDPTYPRERVAFMLEDAGVSVIVTQKRFRDRLPKQGADVICLDEREIDGRGETLANPQSDVRPDHLAYMIYTSGSTGKPKGVMIEHRTVVNFFTGMDQRVGCSEQDTLLAVTSISFDISVLELFWTLTRGSKVVVLSEREAGGGLAKAGQVHDVSGMDFSLFYFASDEGEQAADKYRLLTEGAKFADQHGFAAVWTPERHFHQFGGLYPNPSVMAAALAMVTEHIELRAGSVVLPLHNPIRVAEEWSVVDNLSNGRVSVSFAAGWNSDDFALLPENFTDRNRVMYESIDTVQRLWQGEKVPFQNGTGQMIDVSILPRPVQAELPVWITSGGNPNTFVQAGAIGANLLTHLLGQSVEEVAEKIKLYRQSLVEHGYDPSTRRVALMLHTFVGDDLDTVRELVREPFTQYLRSSVGLFENLLRTLNPDLDLNHISQADMDDLAAYAFDRYFETSGLFGTPESCLEMVASLKEIGVDEIACLIDFGVASNTVLESLTHLNQLRQKCVRVPDEPVADHSLIAQAVRHQATMLQCTPTLMKMLGTDEEALRSLQTLRAIMLGGEALPGALAAQLRRALPVRLLNMYGPTEATVWATTYEVSDWDESSGTVLIGKPFANVQAYILDGQGQPVPVGVPGELHIGGNCLARGYYKREDLTAEKFIPNLFGAGAGERLYKTGDLVRWLPDGEIEFLGRIDHQVKIRGFRIELGEIEALLGQHQSVEQAVVIAREDVPGDVRLVAYLIAAEGMAPTGDELREFVKRDLPEHMVPAIFVVLERFPMTLNGKIDRKSLPAPVRAGSAERVVILPRTEHEQRVAEIWQEVLGVAEVSMQDHFFAHGGHSLLATQLISRIRKAFDVELTLRNFFEVATVEGLARAIESVQAESLGEEDADLARLLAELDDMTEEEAEALLMSAGEGVEQ